MQQYAEELGFSSLDQTKLVTAASELSRNTLDHGGGGEMVIEVIRGERKQGMRMKFEDRGPGIDDIDQALTDGFTTGDGMGLGLGGARRLMNEFEIAPREGGGLVITATRWA